RSSLLSKHWRSLWLQVPVFDLDSLQFDGDVFGFIEFVDKFLKSYENLALNRFNYLEPELIVSLPCLKVMHLDRVRYDKSIKRDESNLETLITSCPVFEKLTIIRDSFELLEIIRVRSKSLKSFALVAEDSEVGLLEDHIVEIDAPKLERMSL
ncbi:unnamed protein product, partial [Brassica rapa subsp. trilocularis]